MRGVAPTVSGENRDSKIYGAEISWSCAQEGQNTPQTEVRFYLLLIVRCNSIDSFGSILGTFSALIVQYCQSKPEKTCMKIYRKNVSEQNYNDNWNTFRQ